MQNDLVASPNVLASIHAMKSLIAWTLEFQVSYVGDASNLASQSNLRQRLNDFAGSQNRGFVKRGAALNIEQLLPFRESEEFAAINLRALVIPSNPISGQQKSSSDEPRFDPRAAQLADQSSNLSVELVRFIEDCRLFRFQKRSIPMFNLNHKEPAGANADQVDLVWDTRSLTALGTLESTIQRLFDAP